MEREVYELLSSSDEEGKNHEEELNEEESLLLLGMFESQVDRVQESDEDEENIIDDEEGDASPVGHSVQEIYTSSEEGSRRMGVVHEDDSEAEVVTLEEEEGEEGEDVSEGEEEELDVFERSHTTKRYRNSLPVEEVEENAEEVVQESEQEEVEENRQRKKVRIEQEDEQDEEGGEEGEEEEEEEYEVVEEQQDDEDDFEEVEETSSAAVEETVGNEEEGVAGEEMNAAEEWEHEVSAVMPHPSEHEALLDSTDSEEEMLREQTEEAEEAAALSLEHANEEEVEEEQEESHEEEAVEAEAPEAVVKAAEAEAVVDGDQEDEDDLDEDDGDDVENELLRAPSKAPTPIPPEDLEARKTPSKMLNFEAEQVEQFEQVSPAHVVAEMPPPPKQYYFYPIGETIFDEFARIFSSSDEIFVKSSKLWDPVLTHKEIQRLGQQRVDWSTHPEHCQLPIDKIDLIMMSPQRAALDTSKQVFNMKAVWNVHEASSATKILPPLISSQQAKRVVIPALRPQLRTVADAGLVRSKLVAEYAEMDFSALPEDDRAWWYTTTRFMYHQGQSIIKTYPHRDALLPTEEKNCYPESIDHFLQRIKAFRQELLVREERHVVLVADKSVIAALMGRELSGLSFEECLSIDELDLAALDKPPTPVQSSESSEVEDSSDEVSGSDVEENNEDNLEEEEEDGDEDDDEDEVGEEEDGEEGEDEAMDQDEIEEDEGDEEYVELAGEEDEGEENVEDFDDGEEEVQGNYEEDDEDEVVILSD